jgi:hypothetical protein
MLQGIGKFSHALGGANTPNTAYKGLAESADQPVKDLLLQRKSEQARAEMLKKLWEMKHGKPMSPFERGTLNLKRQELAQKRPPETALDKAINREYGKKIVDWNEKRPETMRNLSGFREVANMLDTGKATTGPGVGLLPDWARQLMPFDDDTGQRTIAARKEAERAIGATLKETLGAQFAKVEGERILSQLWGPRADSKINASRINRAADTLQSLINRKDAMQQWAQTHGSMKGFKAPPINISPLFPTDENMDIKRRIQAALDSTSSTGQTTESTSLSTEDSEAIKWAKSNPNDPRAQQILKLNGVQ